MQRSTDERVRVLFGGDSPFTLFELVDENVLEITVYGRRHSSVESNNYVEFDDFVSMLPSRWRYNIGFRRAEFRDRIELQLSEDQADHIRYLIENVARRRSDRRFEGTAIHTWDNDLYVLAIINGRTYWTWEWSSYSGHYNLELMELAVELAELSPVDVRRSPWLFNGGRENQ